MSNIDPNMDPSTILYIDACVEKWKPLVEDMAEERKGFTSYLCERESKYLQDVYGDMSPAERGAKGGLLKWIFPILRRLSENIALGETEFGRIYDVAVAVVEDMSEPVWCVGGMRDSGPPEEVREVLSPLVERAHAGLLAYKKIVGRRVIPPVMG
jgi:hypothetical protein